MPTQSPGESLLFVDKVVADDARCLYSACELNRHIRPWQQTLPSKATVFGTERGIIVHRRGSGKQFVLRSGPHGTVGVIDGRETERRSPEEALKSRIENRCVRRLEPAIVGGTLPVFVGCTPPTMPGFPVEVVLMPVEGEDLFLPYLTLIRIQDQEANGELARKFERKIRLPYPASSPRHEYPLHNLISSLGSGTITLSIMLKHPTGVALGAAVVCAASDNNEHKATIFSSDARAVIQKGSEVFTANRDDLIRIAVVA